MEKTIGLIGMVCLLEGLASASVSDLESAQAAHSNIVYQYTFEGAGRTARLDQKISPNSPDLVQYKLTVANDITFSAGYDSSSQAAATWAGTLASGKRSTGTAMKTAETLSMPTSGTIEYMVKAAAINDSGFAVTGIGGTDRWYFMYNGTTNSTTPKASMTLGANVAHDLIGGTTAVAYEANHWYYVAQTWRISGGTVTMNAWVADMSIETPVLTQTIVNKTAAHMSTTTNLFRLGSNTDTANFFKGNLDAVAVYSTTLDAATIASHFDAIPKAATVGL
jgi:hypothetical protein